MVDFGHPETLETNRLVPPTTWSVGGKRMGRLHGGWVRTHLQMSKLSELGHPLNEAVNKPLQPCSAGTLRKKLKTWSNDSWPMRAMLEGGHLENTWPAESLARHGKRKVEVTIHLDCRIRSFARPDG